MFLYFVPDVFEVGGLERARFFLESSSLPKERYFEIYKRT